MKLNFHLHHPVFLICVVTQLFARSAVLAQQPKVYRLTSLDHSWQVLTYKERYQHENFLKGKVYLISGDENVARFNYNYVRNEIQFINPKNQQDTLSLLDNNLVRFASIGDSIYYHDNKFGYVQIIEDHGDIKLGKKQGFVSIGNDKFIGYNQYIATSASNNYHSYVSANGQMSKLEKKTELIVTNRTSYFFVDRNGKLNMAYRGSLLKIFSKHKKAVLNYLGQNAVDFKNEQDLKKLVFFCSKLGVAN